MATGKKTNAYLLSAHHISARGLALIGKWEGTYLRPYNDPAGHATVGIGHLLHYGPVTAADRCGVWVKGQKQPGVLTVQEAWKLLKRDLRRPGSYEAAVRALTRRGVILRQPQFDALVSFVYNCGPGAIGMVPQRDNSFVWRHDATAVARALYRRIGKRGSVARHYLHDCGDAMKQWNKAEGRVLQGLVNRRNDEVRLLLS